MKSTICAVSTTLLLSSFTGIVTATEQTINHEMVAKLIKQDMQALSKQIDVSAGITTLRPTTELVLVRSDEQLHSIKPIVRNNTPRLAED